MVNILLMHGVSAMGQKIIGLVESSAADPFAMSFIATAQELPLVTNRHMKRSSKAGIRAGHFLKIVYPTGDGVELCLVFLITVTISSGVNGLQSISTSGNLGVGIHAGWTKFRGTA